MFFAVAACLLSLCGCTHKTVPDYDRLKSQLFGEACDALAGTDTKQADTLLKRYLDAVPDSRFARLALAHERSIRIIRKLNAALENGDCKAVAQVFDEDENNPQGYQELAGYENLPPALVALQKYLRQRPFSSSEEMKKARKRVDEYLPMLHRSPSFQHFWKEQQGSLKALEAKEKTIAVRGMVQELDLAAVSGDISPQILLADLGATAPENPVYRANLYVQEHDWSGFRDMAVQALHTGKDYAALEIACCLQWTTMGKRERRVLGKLFSGEEPQSLSGFALQAWQSAMDGRFARSVQCAHVLAESASPSPALIRAFLTHCVLPEEQFNAWCWRSAAPGITDFLGRIEQLGENDPSK